MPIQVTCAHCNQKLRAKDKLAGKKVNCPKCEGVIQIPELDTRETRVAKANEKLHENLLQALTDGELEIAAPLMHKRTFWLLEIEEGSGQPLCAEVEEVEVMVVFTETTKAEVFGESNEEFLDDEGSLSLFSVRGEDLLANFPAEMGILLNPESDNFVVSPEGIEELKEFFDSELPNAKVQVTLPTVEERDAQGDPRAVQLREQVMNELKSTGFQPAAWLPLTDIFRDVRPEEEIARRLFALGALFAWASAPRDAVPDQQLQELVDENRLIPFLTVEEQAIWNTSREAAQEEHSGSIGWKLENMWALAWVLGYDKKPPCEAGQISQDVIHEMFFDYMGGLNVPFSEFLANSKIRDSEQVIALEDLFYCGHNAVRSAQFNSTEDTQFVPTEFDPVGDGGVVHERRHSLTWCLSPGVDWDATDLST